MKVELTAAAEQELDEAIAYYDQQKPGLGKALAGEVRRTGSQITEYPRAWQILDPNTGIRRCLLNRFPYGLIYAIEGDDTALVLAVMHLHREPAYWRDRLRKTD